MATSVLVSRQDLVLAFRSPLFAKASRRILLAALFWVVAAASFSGFVGKWALRDNALLEPPKRFPIEAILDGTAYRPFVYRQLVPLLADNADRAVTPAIRNRLRDACMRISTTIVPTLHPESTFARVRADQEPRYHFRYLVVFYTVFFSLFLSLFVLRRSCMLCGVEALPATLAAAAFLLALPYLETVGGYYYDSVELLLCGLAFIAAVRGRVIWLVAIAAVATLNKETFFFLLPSLYPLLRLRLSKRASGLTTGGAILVSGAINLALKAHFAGNPGVATENHLWTNLAAYARLRTYGRVEATYGVIGPGGVSLLTMVIVAAVLVLGWKHCGTRLRQHVLVAAAINIALFVAFCEVGELRNFSLLYVGFVVLMGYVIEASAWRGERRPLQRAF